MGIAQARFTNPQVTQGSSATFSGTGFGATTLPSAWQIVNAGGTVVASASNTLGWNVSYSSGTNQFTVTAPASAPVATGYTAKYYSVSVMPPFHSAVFDVVSGASTSPPNTPGGFAFTPTGGGLILGWTASANATAYTIKRAYISGGPYTTLTSTATGTTYVDGGLTNNLTYYYKIAASNSYGASADSAELAATPKDNSMHFEVVGIKETRAHNVQVSINVINTVDSTQSVTRGPGADLKTYYLTVKTTHLVGTDGSLNDNFITSDGSAAFGQIVTDQIDPAHPSFTAMCQAVNSQLTNVKFSTTSTGGAARVLLIEQVDTTGYWTDQNGISGAVTPTTTYTVVQREDYNIIRQNASAVAIDSRLTYGQANLDGELPGDPNADARNMSFLGWNFKGGLFVGNASLGSGDRSGTARTQIYLDSLPTLIHPIWSAFTSIYIGTTTNFDGDVNVLLSVPSFTDPNIGTAIASAVWSNKWDLTNSQPRSDVLLNASTPIGEYVCFQNPGLATRLILSLKGEAAAVTGGYNQWRYFANVSYATSGLVSAADAQPRMWIIDRTKGEPNP